MQPIGRRHAAAKGQGEQLLFLLQPTSYTHNGEAAFWPEETQGEASRCTQLTGLNTAQHIRCSRGH